MNRIPRTMSSDEQQLVAAFLRSNKVTKIKCQRNKTYKEVVVAYKRGRTRSLNAQARNRKLAQEHNDA